MQDRAGEGIRYEKHDREGGSPDSASVQRIAASIERNVRQQLRLQRGIEAGQIDTRELSGLLYAQARLNWREARFAADGWVDPEEYARIDHAQNRQSERIWERRHDESTRW